jgi:hypothetical protein
VITVQREFRARFEKGIILVDQSASELYRPSDRRLLATLDPTFADTECHVVSVTDPYGSILAF